MSNVDTTEITIDLTYGVDVQVHFALLRNHSFVIWISDITSKNVTTRPANQHEGVRPTYGRAIFFRRLFRHLRLSDATDSGPRHTNSLFFFFWRLHGPN